MAINAESTRTAIDRRLLIASLLVLALVGGFLIADDYGISTDEPINYDVGEAALRSLVSWQGFRDYSAHGEPLAHHGPSYFMLFAGGAEVFQRLVPGWHIADARHWMNYLTFLLGCGALYALSRRFMRPGYALLTAVFFASQPLLLGHAFINQKDTPFLVFFTLSVVVGLAAVDRFHSGTNGDLPRGARTEPGLRYRVRLDWEAATRLKRIVFLAVTALVLLVLADVLFFERGLGLATSALARAYVGEAWAPLQRAFDAVAVDAYKTPLDLYTFKLTWMYWIGRAVVLAGTLGAVLWVSLWAFPTAFGSPWRRWRAGLLLGLVAGGVLGFTISIRQVGGFAAVLVGIYALYRLGWRSIPLFVSFGLAAALVTYLTWPYLWPAPVDRLVESLLLSGDFDKPTLYRGGRVMGASLPWHYFPLLAGITLTEPFAPLLLIGMPVAAWRARRGNVAWIELLILVLWIGVPLYGLLGLNMGVYDNIRHLHFVLVPLFVVAGIGLAWALDALGNAWLRVALAGLVLAPAALGIAQLHPYEHAYYNAYVGGIDGAAGRYTVDRWCTSYREAMDYVNQVAEPNALITALNSPMAARPFARYNLKVSFEYEHPPEDTDYVLTCSFFIGGYMEAPEWRRVHTVGRGEAVFAEVYERVGH